MVLGFGVGMLGTRAWLRVWGLQGQGLLLMIEILQYLKDPKLWESWSIPYYGQCRI